MNKIPKFDEFLNEFNSIDEYELRQFLIDVMKIKPSLISNHVYNRKGKDYKNELIASFKNNKNNLDLFAKYIRSVILNNDSVFK